MNQLLEIGFQTAGHWDLDGDRIRFDIVRHGSQNNILYAFVCDGEVKYVGKTTVSLSRRMRGYRSPGGRQSTNIKNNQLIREALLRGTAVEILALPDSGLLKFGPFQLNLAAGLEDDVIRLLQPEWNGGQKEPPEEATQAANEPEEAREGTGLKTSFVLQPTYYRRGFFNVGKAATDIFGADGETIEIFLGSTDRPVIGTINRTANKTRAPRIMGGPAVRDWFIAQGEEGQFVSVEVNSPTSIRLHLQADWPRTPGSPNH
jgi:hypothetical protein